MPRQLTAGTNAHRCQKSHAKPLVPGHCPQASPPTPPYPPRHAGKERAGLHPLARPSLPVRHAWGPDHSPRPSQVLPGCSPHTTPQGPSSSQTRFRPTVLEGSARGPCMFQGREFESCLFPSIQGSNCYFWGPRQCSRGEGDGGDQDESSPCCRGVSAHLGTATGQRGDSPPPGGF